jgi:pimeloyl-ACP methyl ester carboxylesterase
VACHVADLRDLISARLQAGDPLPALVGWSWGAMLALAYSAAHPEPACPVVLIGCGTFDLQARARFKQLLEERTLGELAREMAALEQTIPDPDERLRRKGELLDSVYNVDPIREELEGAECDQRANRETWDDMLRLQREGLYPAAFCAIRAPVLMLHGEEDPHPGEMIRDGLRPHLPQLEYRAWPRCGHTPWAERTVRSEFLSVLRAWLAERLHV